MVRVVVAAVVDKRKHDFAGLIAVRDSPATATGLRRTGDESKHESASDQDISDQSMTSIHSGKILHVVPLNKWDESETKFLSKHRNKSARHQSEAPASTKTFPTISISH